MKTRHPIRLRRGVTTVEVALVLGILFLFLFGIFEYSRYLLVLHVTGNAARSGARYASVNVARNSNFDTVNSSLLDSQGRQLVSIRQYTTNRMGGLQGMIQGFQVNTFACEPEPLYNDPPTFVPKTGLNWNDASFGERIVVRITGTYRPILPSFLAMPSSIPINVAAAISSEG